MRVRFDVRRWLAGWMMAAPVAALAWPLAEQLGQGPLATALLARVGVAEVMRAARKLHPAHERRDVHAHA